MRVCLVLFLSVMLHCRMQVLFVIFEISYKSQCQSLSVKSTSFSITLRKKPSKLYTFFCEKLKWFLIHPSETKGNLKSWNNNYKCALFVYNLNCVQLTLNKCMVGWRIGEAALKSQSTVIDRHNSVCDSQKASLNCHHDHQYLM